MRFDLITGKDWEEFARRFPAAQAFFCMPRCEMNWPSFGRRSTAIAGKSSGCRNLRHSPR